MKNRYIKVYDEVHRYEIELQEEINENLKKVLEELQTPWYKKIFRK